MTNTVIVHPDAPSLAAASAARFITKLIDLQSVRRPTHVVLTGGEIGIEMLHQVAISPAKDAVDWSGIHFWWGDERFLPEGDLERNETQAREALLDHLPDVPPHHIHPMLGPDQVDTPEESAQHYRGTLELHDAQFDLVILGVGPDGHVASLFPNLPTWNETDTDVIGVHNSPKPPPLRVSLTLPRINSANEIWVIAAGAEKQVPVAAGLLHEANLPIGCVAGQSRTLWLIDMDSAP